MSNTWIGVRQLTSVCAAIQKQITSDFYPIWNVRGTIDPFTSLDDVPLGYWPIIVMDDIKSFKVAGVHQDRMGQPFSLVKAGQLWSLAASHEALEMLADPSGNRTIAGPRPMTVKTGSSVVEYLVAICDPCEDLHYAYDINGIPVSDFCTPDYFEPQKPAVDGTRYDIARQIKEPLDVLPKGYLTWHDSQAQGWFRLTASEEHKLSTSFADVRSSGGRHMRSRIDAQVESPLEALSLGDHPSFKFDKLGNGDCTRGSCVACMTFINALKSQKLLLDGPQKAAAKPSHSDASALREDIAQVMTDNIAEDMTAVKLARRRKRK
jgi:hypothetical protein